MSGSNVCGPISTFSAEIALPAKLHHCGRGFGLLVSIQPDEDCQIALIVNRFGERRIVLPQDLDLSAYISQRIGLIRVDQLYLVRRLA